MHQKGSDMQLVQKQIRISEEDWDHLAEVAAERHLRPSQLARILILAYLDDLAKVDLPEPVALSKGARNRLEELAEAERLAGVRV